MNTHRLDKDTDLLKLTGTAFGTQRDSTVQGYLRLPITAPDGPLPNTSWLLLLELTGKNYGLLPFDIAGDVVLGRGIDGPDAPDLDLTALQAFEMGVSRRHAMLRPTTNHLYLIDLGSTNGTTVNGLSTGKGAVPLRRHDHVTIGQLNMRVLNLERISGTLEKPADAGAPASVVVQITEPPRPPMPTPPLEARMPSIQKPDPTLPLPGVVETIPPEKVEAAKEDSPQPEQAAKPIDPPAPDVEPAKHLDLPSEQVSKPVVPPPHVEAPKQIELPPEQPSPSTDLPPLDIEDRKTIKIERKLDSQTS